MFGNVLSIIKDYIVTTPEGDEIEIKGLKKFCNEHNLSPSKMVQVAKRKRNHHKQYKMNYN